MGGFGSGGKRTGAGRKSKDSKERDLAGSRNRTQARDANAAAPAVAVSVAVSKPEGLSPMVGDLWDLLAPEATAAGTLTSATAYAFKRLCELEAQRQAMAMQIDLDGIMVNVVQTDEDGGKFSLGAPVAHPLLSHERQLQVRVEQGMARFMITALGKSMVKAKEEDDPFAAFGRMQLVQGGKA